MFSENPVTVPMSNASSVYGRGIMLEIFHCCEHGHAEVELFDAHTKTEFININKGTLL
jgi:hypothetical protein